MIVFAGCFFAGHRGHGGWNEVLVERKRDMRKLSNIWDFLGMFVFADPIAARQGHELWIME